MSKFLTIGEPLVVFGSEDLNKNLSESAHFTKHLAGAELNVAIGLSRLGLDCSYASAVGNDPFGKFIKDEISNNGIDTSLIKVDEKNATGFYFKEFVDTGDPKILYFRKNSAASYFKYSDLSEDDFNGLELIHTSGIMAGISQNGMDAVKELLKKAQELNINSTFDPNIRTQLWASTEEMVSSLNKLAAEAKIVLPGINEGKILAGTDDYEKIADFYLNQSEVTNQVVVKLGPAGAYYKDRNNESFLVDGFKVDKVVDTVGAGDGFAVGLISGILKQKSFKEAMVRACAVGALAVQSAGDNDGYPTEEELKKYIEENNG